MAALADRALFLSSPRSTSTTAATSPDRTNLYLGLIGILIALVLLLVLVWYVWLQLAGFPLPFKRGARICLLVQVVAQTDWIIRRG